jgi:hypothetical protein
MARPDILHNRFHILFNQDGQQESEMTESNNGPIHHHVEAYVNTAHELRARQVGTFFKGLWASLTGTKPSSANLPHRGSAA